jgi:hypothetical protein
MEMNICALQANNLVGADLREISVVMRKMLATAQPERYLP